MLKWLFSLLLLIAAGTALADPRTVHYTNLAYADSLAAGDSLTTAAVPCFGATYIVFYWSHADTTGTCGGVDCRSWYSDSLSAGGLQFSNDGTNWGTTQAGISQVNAAGFTMLGVALNNVSFARSNATPQPSTIGGIKLCGAFAGTNSTTHGPGMILVRWARFKMVNQSRGR